MLAAFPQPYNGSLSLSTQQVRVKISIEVDISLPHDAVQAQEYKALVEIILADPLNKNPPQLSRFSASLQEQFDMIRQHLDPYFINMHCFQEHKSNWPTIGAVQDYVIWLLTGERLPSNLDVTLRNIRVGKMEQPPIKSMTRLKEHQDFLVEALLSFFKEEMSSTSPPSRLTNFLQNFSLDELLLIHSQFTGNINETGVESHVANDILCIVDGQSYYEDYTRAVALLIDQCTTRIQYIKTFLANPNFQTTDIGVLRSFTLEQCIAACQRETYTGIFFGAILSCIPSQQWNEFLKKTSIPFTFDVNEYIRILNIIPRYQWKDLLNIPGLSQALQTELRKYNVVSKTIQLLSHDLYFAGHIFAFSMVWDILPSNIQDTKTLIKLLKCLQCDALAYRLDDPALLKMLNNIKVWKDSEIRDVLISFKLLRDSKRYQSFMRSSFFIHHVFETGLIYTFHPTIPAEYVVPFFSDLGINQRIHISLKKIPDIVNMFYLFSKADAKDDFFNFILKRTVVEKIKSFPIGVAAIVSVIDLFPPERKNDAIKIFKWNNFHPDIMFSKNALLDFCASSQETFQQEYMSLICKLFAEGRPNIYVYGDEFISTDSVVTHLQLLPPEHWKRFLMLPNMNKHFDIEESIIFNDELIALFNQSPRTLITFFNIPSIDQHVEALLNHDDKIFPTMYSPALLWNVLTHSKAALSYYQRCVAQDKATLFYVCLNKAKPTPEQACKILEATRAGYQQYDLTHPINSAYSRFYQVEPPSRPFLENLEQLVGADLNHHSMRV